MGGPEKLFFPCGSRPRARPGISHYVGSRGHALLADLHKKSGHHWGCTMGLPGWTASPFHFAFAAPAQRGLCDGCTGEAPMKRSFESVRCAPFRAQNHATQACQERITHSFDLRFPRSLDPAFLSLQWTPFFPGVVHRPCATHGGDAAARSPTRCARSIRARTTGDEMRKNERY